MYMTLTNKEANMRQTTEYTPTQLKQNSSEIFNEVQKEEMVIISSKTRPDMVLMTLENYEHTLHTYDLKINNLVDAIKHLESKNKEEQLDLLSEG
jgi:prevent-host-death family protein